ncbi:type IV toxin-antitoxin system AbiEi family antitoxin domain-containing protein [Slackia heliotrinireducens]|nr:type IV toxin-antitoxin system AbiEi family antitoxin domain-containing protein [Slackia heliotrinireducens]
MAQQYHFWYYCAMTYYDDIYEIAVDNYYLISTQQAQQAGIPSVELAKLAHRGKLSHVSHGLYRLVRHVPHENDSYAIAVARVGNGAYLYGESVIALLNLAPTDPSRIYVASPHRVRGRKVDGLETIVRGEVHDVTAYEGIPSQEIGSAIRSCIGSVMPERLRAAAERARNEGYLTPKNYQATIEAIERHEKA